MPDISPIFDNPEHYTEIRVLIGDISHDVISCEITGGLNQSANVGGVESRQLDLTIAPADVISDDDAVQIFTRLSSPDNSQKSDWIPKGTFFIDTISYDSETGTASIHGFDAMMKAEQDILDDEETDANWPKTPTEVMTRISQAIGVPLDSRNNLNNNFLVPYPTENSLRDVSGESAGPPYVLNTDTKIIHRTTCRRVPSIDARNREVSEDSLSDLKSTGYRVCRVCRPTDGESDDEPDDSASLSMRTVAGHIAAMQGGNWIVTDPNTLYLVPVEIFNSSVSLLSANNSTAIAFGNVLILV